MDFRDKLLLLGGLMIFSLFFALTPSGGGVREISGNSESVANLKNKLTKLEEQNKLLRLDKEEDEAESQEEYPLYETLKTTEQQINLTPEELENLPLRQHSSSLFELSSDVEEVEAAAEDDSIFSNQEEYDQAPYIKVLAESKKIDYRLIVLQHERYYRTHASKLAIPRLKPNVHLTKEEFAQRFLYKSQPVIVPFEAMRHLNFTTKAKTIPELLEMYPNHKETLYEYGMHLDPNEEIDLGPAIAMLAQNRDLKKTTKGRNFPRNLKVNLGSISMLDVQHPPYFMDGTKLMAPAVWFGVSSSSTATHSDCCDNFAMMISGTKRWTIAPPSEARIIKPFCQAGLCWAKKMQHADEHATSYKAKKMRDQLQLITFDLNPGELLYLPCGWWHHVENVGPTIMVNFWAKDKPYFLQLLDGDVDN